MNYNELQDKRKVFKSLTTTAHLCDLHILTIALLGDDPDTTAVYLATEHNVFVRIEAMSPSPEPTYQFIGKHDALWDLFLSL